MFRFTFNFPELLTSRGEKKENTLPKRRHPHPVGGWRCAGVAKSHFRNLFILTQCKFFFIREDQPSGG